MNANLAPRKHWRLAPIEASCNIACDLAADMRAGRDSELLLPTDQRAVIELLLPPRAVAAMLTFNRCFGAISALAEVSGDWAEGPWRQVSLCGAFFRHRDTLDKAIVPASPQPTRLRLTLWAPKRVRERMAVLRVGDIGLYSLDPAGGDDYWLFLGASIQEQSIRNGTFKRMVLEQFGYDPVAFSLAVGGWTTSELLRSLPGFLNQHEHARFVAIHIGGNNVSRSRPYPGGASLLRIEVQEILKMVLAAGKVPVLARVSYRAYKSPPPGRAPGSPDAGAQSGAVCDEADGSLPYNLHVIDPLIKQYCPDFYDIAAGRGKVDLYEHFRDHASLLQADGVHLEDDGEDAWTGVWAKQAGSVIYGRPATS